MHEPSTYHRSLSQEPGDTRHDHRINRRRLIGIASTALAAPLAPIELVAAQRGESTEATPDPGTPIASPAATTPVDVETLLSLSTQLVGVDELNADAAEPLAGLIGADPALVSGFEELTQLDDPTAQDARSTLSDNASAAANNILQYWYLGYFKDQPVENRAEIFFTLPTWSTVPYSTQPTLCKAFGYWATEISLDSE